MGLNVLNIPPEAIHLSNLGLPHKLVWTFSFEVPPLSLQLQPSWRLLSQ
jgi:hypothetical protein